MATMSDASCADGEALEFFAPGAFSGPLPRAELDDGLTTRPGAPVSYPRDESSRRHRLLRPIGCHGGPSVLVNDAMAPRLTFGDPTPAMLEIHSSLRSAPQSSSPRTSRSGSGAIEQRGRHLGITEDTPPHPPLRYHRDWQRQLAPSRRSPDNPRSRCLRNPDQLRRRERYRQNPSLKRVKCSARPAN